jgi:hypothetical protein
MATITAPRCLHCGVSGTIELTDAEVHALETIPFIHKALPNRTADERELLISGTHPACWDAMFPQEDEEDDLNFDEVPFDEPTF